MDFYTRTFQRDWRAKYRIPEISQRIRILFDDSLQLKTILMQAKSHKSDHGVIVTWTLELGERS
jgi:hypothetical protein